MPLEPNERDLSSEALTDWKVEAEMLRGQLLEMAEERGELSEKAERTDELELQLENLIRAAKAHPRLILWLKIMDDFRESIRETVGEDAEPEVQWRLAIEEVEEGLMPAIRLDLVVFINRLAALSYWSSKLADRQVERGVAELAGWARPQKPA